MDVNKNALHASGIKYIYIYHVADEFKNIQFVVKVRQMKLDYWFDPFSGSCAIIPSVEKTLACIGSFDQIGTPIRGWSFVQTGCTKVACILYFNASSSTGI